ncbi:MAG: mycothiol synthase [Frankiales bacterium]|nr:mycothiol synthase [Frankiales bacterium]
MLRRLADADVTDVGVLVERVTEADGIRPLSEHVTLHLRHGGDVDVRHVLGRVGDELAAYGHLDVTDLVAGASAELAVAPRFRRRGIGRLLVERLVAESPDGRLRLWAHGELSGAASLAESLGFHRSRTLHQMRRSLYAALPEPVWPDGIRLRSFLPGLDDEEWVALNAAAFTDLPDQGGWTIEDLHARMAEPWFDPEGFLVAEDEEHDGRMVGFHWTKVHGADPHHAGHEHTHAHEGEQPHEHGHDDTHHGHEPIGEVYVVGVDPAQRGRGLGRALTLAGLTHLRSLGLPDAMLYVDASNTAAIALYESLGFTHWDVDVEFAV